MPYMPKVLVAYRDATGDKRCGNCIMFREPADCTLVIGKIEKDDVCDEWEPKRISS